MKKYDEIINFYKRYIKIENVLRKEWEIKKIPSKRKESVADHTLQVLFLSSIFERVLDLNINEEKLIDMILIHDIDEILICDIAETEKNHNEKHNKEQNAVSELLDCLNHDDKDYYFMLWKELDERKTYIAKYVYELNKIDTILKSKVYEEEYNIKGLFQEFYKNLEVEETFKDGVLEEFYIYLKEKYVK